MVDAIPSCCKMVDAIIIVSSDSDSEASIASSDESESSEFQQTVQLPIERVSFVVQKVEVSAEPVKGGHAKRFRL